VKLETQPGRSHITGYISREDDATFLLLTLRYRPLSSLCSNPSSKTRSVYKETEFLTSWITKLQYGKLNWPLHQLVRTYHGSQQDALFLNFILVKKNSSYMFQTDLFSSIRSLDTAFTATGNCHISYVDWADSQHN